uniref:ABC transporter substrate-binding protein n=1 Tax=Gemmiger formicilis TaxID=745368 RepID=UPI00402628C9
MKRYLAIFLAVLMMIPTFAMAEGVVKIGVFEPASGDSGAGGKQEMLGMQYANAVQPTVEIGGETYKVELVYADNGSSTDKAPSAAQQLVSEGVSVVLGSYGSGVSIAGSQYFADAGIPAIGVTCTNPQVTAGNSHYFRICFLDPFQGTVLANYAFKELGARTAYCLAELGNDYDVGLCHYFQQAFEAMGGMVISNGLVALSGALLSQYQSFADINMGRGAIVIGLAAVIIGEVIFGKIFRNFALKLTAAVIGAIIYYIVMNFVLRMGLSTDDLKLLTALVVAVFLTIPYWKGKYFTKVPVKKGGKDNA